MQQGETRAWREAGTVALARGIEQILQVIKQRRGSMRLAYVLLDLEQCLDAEYGLEFLKHVAAVHSQKHRAFAGAVRYAQLDPHQKSVELRLRERESADLMLRILRCDNEERLR